MKINKSKDLSHINNLEELRKEIVRVKEDLKIQELQLEERAKRFPSETLKATAGAVFPFVINNAVATRTFGVVKNLTGLFLGGSKSKATTSQKIFNAAKQLGIATALKAGYNFFRKRRSRKKDTSAKERT